MPAVLSAFCVEVLLRNIWHIGLLISNYPPLLYVIGTAFSGHLVFISQLRKLKFDRLLAVN
jgi:hypothetical protein